MPRTRCSRASSSTLGSAPRLVGGALGRGVRGLGLPGVRTGLGAGIGGTVLGGTVLGGTVLGGNVLGRAFLSRGVLSRAFLGGSVLGGAFLSRAFLGGGVLGGAFLSRGVLSRGVLGGPGCPGLGPGLALLGFLGVLAGLALLGGGREALLLVRARLGRPERAFGSRLPGELLPVPGDLEQDADRVGGLRAHRQPVLDPFGVHFDEGGVGLRVILADLLDSAPVALGACVG